MFCFGVFLIYFYSSISPKLDMRRCICDSWTPARVTILETHVNIDSRSLCLDTVIKKLFLNTPLANNVHFYKQCSIANGFRTLCFYISIPTDFLLPIVCECMCVCRCEDCGIFSSLLLENLWIPLLLFQSFLSLVPHLSTPNWPQLYQKFSVLMLFSQHWELFLQHVLSSRLRYFC